MLTQYARIYLMNIFSIDSSKPFSVLLEKGFSDLSYLLIRLIYTKKKSLLAYYMNRMPMCDIIIDKII